jgi:DNA-3-methyladenine glycosylase I
VAPCPWAGNELAIEYHDHEWGVPSHDDRHLFEMLILEGAQAGLSWDTILRKRGNYRRAFDGFDPERVARFTPARIEKLLRDEGLVRNRLKLESAVANARVMLQIRDKFGSLDRYFWSFPGGKPVRNSWKTAAEVPARTPLSDALSRDLKRRGCRFAGSTICYAFLQATGMVNDHLVECPRHGEVDGAAGPRGERGTV